jgi:hypothetical protein
MRRKIRRTGYGLSENNREEDQWRLNKHGAERHAITRKMYMPAWYSAA